MWKGGRRTNDYRFFDKQVSERFTQGGTGIAVHKYIGTNPQDSDDFTQPDYLNQSEQNIQDLLFLENRDRKYDEDVYDMRGIYTMNDSEFDLSQFGLFMTADQIQVNFHLNDMVERLGRKIMAGDVLELQHLKDFHALDQDVPAALKRFYVVQEGSRPAEGYTQTWFAHLWRVKCTPIVDSQEYKDLLDNIKSDILDEDGNDGGITDLMSQYNKRIDINEAIIAQAEADVPESGYDTEGYYIVPIDDEGELADPNGIRSDTTFLDASSSLFTADAMGLSPDCSLGPHYLLGDGIAPNGLPTTVGVAFPGDPLIGDYALRTDYFPNRLFRFDGTKWVKIEDDVRAPLTPGQDQTQIGHFMNNDNITENMDGTTEPEKQALSKAVRRPRADN